MDSKTNWLNQTKLYLVLCFTNIACYVNIGILSQSLAEKWIIVNANELISSVIPSLLLVMYTHAFELQTGLLLVWHSIIKIRTLSALEEKED